MQGFMIHGVVILSHRPDHVAARLRGKIGYRLQRIFRGQRGTAAAAMQPSSCGACASIILVDIEQVYTIYSSKRCRPLGGVYPIGDSWQPPKSDSKLKEVWVRLPDTC
jgi:hypothetical protein